jgi:hypothetical protein
MWQDFVPNTQHHTHRHTHTHTRLPSARSSAPLAAGRTATHLCDDQQAHVHLVHEQVPDDALYVGNRALLVTVDEDLVQA